LIAEERIGDAFCNWAPEDWRRNELAKLLEETVAATMAFFSTGLANDAAAEACGGRRYRSPSSTSRVPSHSPGKSSLCTLSADNSSGPSVGTAIAAVRIIANVDIAFALRALCETRG
jgi:hypothetical protein